MKQNTSIVLGLMLAFALAGVAQLTSPIPAPEMKKLDYFSLNWTEANCLWTLGYRFRWKS